ncbi:hypothetical protein B0H11DRAFT_2203526 [Mycena galericulata]|nr:hypothetical protein B0H11DRAFT_2203526 [Mycena galericulata]
MDDTSPVFLITGCSTGFGRELVLDLKPPIAALKSDFRVIATARRPETLTDLQERGAKVLPLDVTASVQDLAAFATKAIAIYGQVDYLVSNAGFAQGGAVEEVSLEEAQEQFNTNFFGLINTTNAFLPHFRARRAGTLVNIGSEVSCTCPPGTGFYSASKAAVEAISDTWARELAEYGIRSICIQPSGFRTEIFKHAATRPPVKTVEGYALAHGTMDYLSNVFSQTVAGDPAKAARNIIKLVTTKPELPMRFALGEEAYVNFKGFYQKRLEELEATRDLTTGTNFDV